MKAYVMTTGTVFGLLVVADIWRFIEEGPGLAKDPGTSSSLWTAAIRSCWRTAGGERSLTSLDVRVRSRGQRLCHPQGQNRITAVRVMKDVPRVFRQAGSFLD